MLELSLTRKVAVSNPQEFYDLLLNKGVERDANVRGGLVGKVLGAPLTPNGINKSNEFKSTT